MGRFDEIYRRSLEEPEAFWADAAAAIDWVEPWLRVLGGAVEVALGGVEPPHADSKFPERASA